jgi:hypothetical protein
VVESVEEAGGEGGAAGMDEPVESLAESQEEGVTADRHSVDSEVATCYHHNNVTLTLVRDETQTYRF